MDNTSSLEEQIGVLEADFFRSFAEFEDILSKYHEQLFTLSYTQDREPQIQAISRGLKSMAVGFAALAEAFPAMCQARGLNVPD